MMIRPFNYSDADYQSLADISTAVWPDRPSVPQATKENDKRRDPKYYFQRLVVESDGEIIASAICGESDWTHVPGKFFTMIQVRPDHQRNGIGTALYDHIMKDLAAGPPTAWRRSGSRFGPCRSSRLTESIGKRRCGSSSTSCCRMFQPTTR